MLNRRKSIQEIEQDEQALVAIPAGPPRSSQIKHLKCFGAAYQRRTCNPVQIVHCWRPVSANGLWQAVRSTGRARRRHGRLMPRRWLAAGPVRDDGKVRSYRAHGLRKAAQVALAHSRCTGPERMAVSGHATLAQVQI